MADDLKKSKASISLLFSLSILMFADYFYDWKWILLLIH
jgi:hypothetical protein